MHTYIKELLNTNNRVIIPEFGAFIVKHGAKRLVIFNEFLKYNDGLLIDYVAKKENLSKDDATKKVTEFVNDLSAQLKSEKKYELGDFGKLEMNNLNKIVFHQEASVKDTGKTDDKQEKPAAQEKKETPKSAPSGKEEQKAPPSTANTKQQEEQKKTVPPSAQKASSEPAKAKETPKTEQPKTGQQAKPEEKTTPHSSAATPAGTTTRTTSSTISNTKTTYSPPPKTSKRHRTKKQKFTIAFIIIAANVLLITTILIIRDQWGSGSDNGTGDEVVLTPKESESNEPETANETGNKEPGTGANQDQQQSDEQSGQIANDIADDLSNNNASTKEVVGSSSQGQASGKYFVVAGCFSIEDNADRFVTTLRKKGYAAKKFGKINNLHAVCYESFPTFEQAQKALNQIRIEESERAWVHKMN